eukprot:13708580-Heterocapsa_arctica.AAC.1
MLGEVREELDVLDLVVRQLHLCNGCVPVYYTSAPDLTKAPSKCAAHPALFSTRSHPKSRPQRRSKLQWIP